MARHRLLFRSAHSRAEWRHNRPIPRRGYPEAFPFPSPRRSSRLLARCWLRHSWPTCPSLVPRVDWALEGAGYQLVGHSGWAPVAGSPAPEASGQAEEELHWSKWCQVN